MSKKSNKKDAVGDDQREKVELLEMKKIDTTSLKEQIYQLRQQLIYLIKQKEQIEVDMAKGNDKYMKESFQIEKTIKIQEEEFTDLENNYKLLKNTFEDSRKKHKMEWEAELETLAKKKNSQRELAVKNIAKLTQKIDYLKQFRVRESDYLSTLESLRDKQSANKSHQQRDIEKIKNEHETKRKDVLQIVQREIESIKQVEVNKLQLKMNRQQQIKRENELIQQQIALCQSEKNILEKEYKQLIEGSDKSITNIDTLLSNQASETYERSLRVIKLENKYNKLKEYLSTEIARLDTQIKAVHKEYDDDQKDVQSRIIKLESWLKLKGKDAKKIKACSQMVLNQRSHLQSYLLEVFYEHPELDYKDSTNINQILRLLFIKINSKRPPQTYKNHLVKTEESQISQKKIGY